MYEGENRPRKKGPTEPAGWKSLCFRRADVVNHVVKDGYEGEELIVKKGCNRIS